MRLCQFQYDDQTVELTVNKMAFFDACFVDFKVDKQTDYDRYTMIIHAKKPIILKSLKFVFDYNFGSNDKVFCNGYQSWSESREYGFEEKIPNLLGVAKKYMQYYGDYQYNQIRREKGNLHSWTYGYVRQEKTFHFFGSLSEDSAFSLLQFNSKTNEIELERDCAGMELSHSFPILDFVVMKGSEQQVFDRYFELMELPKLKAKPAIGWTSWYHYYTNITEEIILKNLDAFVEKEVPVDIFQIDDGYCTAIGDWLSVKKSFPNGMGAVANKIKSHGFKSGIWLAPFVCEEKSDIFKNKKNWVLKDDKGQYVKAGYTPLWSGFFYALDFYNKEVQDYINGVFHTLIHKWGFDMLKLDFLYAVCIHPPKNKTKGQVMSAAMDFVRKAAGDKLLLGCGVPLGSAFGKVDYCRIGADIHLKWEHNFLKTLGNRERVSTILSLRSTLGRWQLNGKAFHNDPDVFILRSKENKLNPDQQYSILIINNLLGNLLFTSDFILDYTDEQWAEYQSIFEWKDSEVKRLDNLGEDRYLIHFQNNQKNYVAACNLNKAKTSLEVGKNKVELAPYESLILRV